jgi:hypothetical protein
MWPYIVIGITGSIAIILTIYERVKGHLEHRKRMAKMKQRFVDLEKDRNN